LGIKNLMAEPWEMDWGHQATPAAVQSASVKEPWEMDWGTKSSDQPSGKTFTEKLGETWPARMAKAAYSGLTLPGDVAQGNVSMWGPDGHTNPEVIGRSAETAQAAQLLGLPESIAAGTGRSVAREAGLATPQAPIEFGPGIRAAQTANELGAPLPVGLASENRAVQATTQAVRQIPFVGPKIGEQVAKTVNAAGERVNDIADEMSGGVVDRAGAGATLRPALKGIIEGNNSRIDDSFTSLRNMLDQSAPTELPTTEKVLKQIVAERTAAGQKNPKAGLEDAHNLVDQGATFNGLQRARSDVGNTLNFGEANPGFNAGDLKRVYGGMSRDMEHVVNLSAKEGVDPQVAVAALKDANATAAPIIGFNKTLQKMSNIKTDEGLVGSLTNAANAKTGNVKLLVQLRNTMPKEDFEQIGGVALSELGHNPSMGRFSLDQFTSKWNTMSDRAKSIMFDPQHRETLDSIAAMGSHLKDTNKYFNTSGTAGSIALGDFLKMSGAALGALALQGNPMPLVLGLTGAGSGAVMAKILARPATASSVAKWMRSAILVQNGASPSRLASYRLATVNLQNNLKSIQSENSE
jgi:hypothetical protein